MLLRRAFVRLQNNNYALVSGLGALSGNVTVSFAEDPEGPWTSPQPAYSRPNDWMYWAYMPNIHGQLENGNYSISYSSNAWLPLFFSGWSFADKYWYRQRFVQVDLLGLSPYTTDLASNIALNKPVTVSSTETGANVASNAVDGNNTTRWSSVYSDPQWVYVDLLDRYNISEINILWEAAYASDYQIQVSEDASNWSTVKTVSGNTAIVNEHAEVNATGRFLRIYGIGRATNWGYSIYELEVFGEEAGEQEPQGITDLGGVMSSQYNDSPVGEGIENLIDNDEATKYLTFHNAAWVQFHANGNFIVERYELTSANDNPQRDPFSWTLQGSNDGASWITIDSRSGEDFQDSFQTRSFEFNNTKSFSYYRLNFTNNSSSVLQLGEIELYGIPDYFQASAGSPIQSALKVQPIEESSAPYPVPFSETVNIPVNLSKSGQAEIHIYNVGGVEVKTFQLSLSAGRHVIEWKSSGGNHNKVASGVYFIKIALPGQNLTYKIIKK